MKRVLFVDDESNVLQGLQRMLRPQRCLWDMVFCDSGEEALRRLSEASFDVLVSDMRMPGMNGAQLLAESQMRFPRVARLILSGQADQESLDSLVGVTHRFLSKPCDAALLQSAIDEAGPPVIHPQKETT